MAAGFTCRGRKHPCIERRGRPIQFKPRLPAIGMVILQRSRCWGPRQGSRRA
jgi:hypothetical protein